MNKLAIILSSIIILLSFSFCSATKSNIKDASQENHPFKVIKATYYTWVNQQLGVKEIEITIPIDNSEIQLDTVFFRNMKTQLKPAVNSSQTSFVGKFALPNIQKDYNLDIDPKKEYGNTPPSRSLKTPFELKNNEAVVSYLYKGIIYYYKVNDIEEIEPSTKY